MADLLFASAAQSAAPVVGEEGMKLGQTVFSMSGYIQGIGVLFLILALLWGFVWLMRRYGRFNFLPRPGDLPRDALVMEAQMPLGPRKGLMVVRFLNRRLLLGVTDRHITLLTEEKACHEPHGADFKHILEQAEKNGPDRGGADSGLPSADN
ncbi:MAG: flagellar biosynthetic protein FliO [Desulfovibrio sp.]|nr:flagellar biosynthetic protein FliO [Desulfovibrio sp.]